MSTSINSSVGDNSKSAVESSYSMQALKKLSKIKSSSMEEWQKIFAEAIEAESIDDSDTSLVSSTDITTSADGAKKKHKKPHLGLTMLETLIDKAVTQGVLTANEAADMKSFLENKDKNSATDKAAMAKIFDVLKAYLPAPMEKEDKVAQKKSIDEIRSSMKDVEKKRFNALIDAVAKAKNDNALTAEQLSKINAFIADHDKFDKLMAKIDAAGITPDLSKS